MRRSQKPIPAELERSRKSPPFQPRLKPPASLRLVLLRLVLLRLVLLRWALPHWMLSHLASQHLVLQDLMSLRSAWLRLRMQRDWQSQLSADPRRRPASGPWGEPGLSLHRAECLQARLKNLGLWFLQAQSQRDEQQGLQMCQRPPFPRVGQALPWQDRCLMAPEAADAPD